MKNFYDFEKLKREIKLIRKLLIFYTVLPFLFFIFYFLGLTNPSLILYCIINYSFLMIFLSFIWIKMPMNRYDKIGETILILIFGWFALWMWIPDEKQLKAMISNVAENEL